MTDHLYGGSFGQHLAPRSLPQAPVQKIFKQLPFLKAMLWDIKKPSPEFLKMVAALPAGSFEDPKELMKQLFLYIDKNEEFRKQFLEMFPGNLNILHSLVARVPGNPYLTIHQGLIDRCRSLNNPDGEEIAHLKYFVFQSLVLFVHGPTNPLLYYIQNKLKYIIGMERNRPRKEEAMANFPKEVSAFYHLDPKWSRPFFYRLALNPQVREPFIQQLPDRQPEWILFLDQLPLTPNVIQLLKEGVNIIYGNRNQFPISFDLKRLIFNITVIFSHPVEHPLIGLMENQLGKLFKRRIQTVSIEEEKDFYKEFRGLPGVISGYYALLLEIWRPLYSPPIAHPILSNISIEPASGKQPSESLGEFDLITPEAVIELVQTLTINKLLYQIFGFGKLSSHLNNIRKIPPTIGIDPNNIHQFSFS